MVRSNSPVKTNLSSDSRSLGSLHHGLALPNRVARWLFHENVSTRLTSGDKGQGMPMVWSGNDDDLRLFLGNEFAEILVSLW